MSGNTLLGAFLEGALIGSILYAASLFIKTTHEKNVLSEREKALDRCKKGVDLCEKALDRCEKARYRCKKALYQKMLEENLSQGKS